MMTYLVIIVFICDSRVIHLGRPVTPISMRHGSASGLSKNSCSLCRKHDCVAVGGVRWRGLHFPLESPSFVCGFERVEYQLTSSGACQTNMLASPAPCSLSLHLRRIMEHSGIPPDCSPPYFVNPSQYLFERSRYRGFGYGVSLNNAGCLCVPVRCAL